MDTTAVVVAVIAGVVALVSAVISARAALKSTEEERRSKAKKELERYRDPLFDAAWQLGSRIDNIRHKEFFDGYLDGPRDQDARLSTLFRFANYFGWREAVRREVQLLRFENDKDTKSVATALNDVAAIFSTDSLDDGRGMLWAEEQRAIGELMVTERHDGSATVRGHAEFWEDYGEDFAKWMDRFGDEILTLEAADSERFRYLQWGLWAVARRLGGESGFGYEDSKWIERAGDESVGRAVDPDSQAVERLREHLRDLTE